MRRTRFIACALALLAVVVPASPGATDVRIPPRPEQLVFPPLSFTPPAPEEMRFALGNGIPVYARADRTLPLISISVMFRGGEYLQPAGKEGLAAVTSEVWRTGGAGELSAQELDERLDFLAALLATGIGEVTGSVRLSVLSKDFEAALSILMDVLLRPRFDAERFTRAKDDLIQSMKTRNDDTRSIERREWNRIVYGDDFWLNRLATKASVDALTVEDARTFVRRFIGADNVVVAVSGDFERPQLAALLEGSLGTLGKIAALLPPVPQPEHQAAPGVYLVDKPDVNQGRVSIGHLGYRFGHPAELPLTLMNEVLGGSGFTSWITQRVRSDEGLAYSAFSMLSFPLTFPGVFRAGYQSKSRTVPGAAAIINELIARIRTEKVPSEQLQTVKTSLIETFPRNFESAEATAELYASDELLGRPHDYWLRYRERIEAVTAEQVLNAAREYLHPQHTVTVVVGEAQEILRGHPDYAATLEALGPITRVPLRDPLTLEPLP